MATPFSKVIETAMVTIQDYRLSSLFIEDEDAFMDVMCGFLIKAIPKFSTSSMTSLEYSIDDREFLADLDDCEIDILADWVGYLWMQDIQQDVLELKASLNNADFRRIEQPALLKARTAYLEYIRRKIKIDEQNYMYQHLDSIDFGGGA